MRSAIKLANTPDSRWRIDVTAGVSQTLSALAGDLPLLGTANLKQLQLIPLHVTSGVANTLSALAGNLPLFGTANSQQPQRTPLHVTSGVSHTLSALAGDLPLLGTAAKHTNPIGMTYIYASVAMN